MLPWCLEVHLGHKAFTVCTCSAGPVLTCCRHPLLSATNHLSATQLTARTYTCWPTSAISAAMQGAMGTDAEGKSSCKPVHCVKARPTRNAKAAHEAPSTTVSHPDEQYLLSWNLALTAPRTNRTTMVRPHAQANRAVVSRMGAVAPATTNATIGNKPKKANEASIVAPSLSDSIESPSLGTGKASSSVIMMSTKKSLYLAILWMTTSASSRDIPRATKSSTISLISPSGKFCSSHISRSRSFRT
mmetsp:Transcript_71194/g.141167  ORF Transcript_71194/g.141167 Transcript_71194/m.141167 type:complete len:245 (+) Transcript_71194:111-845(+)